MRILEDGTREPYTMELTCEACIGDVYCGKPAVWMAEWSDRRVLVCDEHKHDAQEWHDNDHDYDQTGIAWTKLAYHEDIIAYVKTVPEDIRNFPDIIIQGVREVSDEVALKEIRDMRSETPSVSIAEIAERTCLGFDQIERIVKYLAKWNR